MKAPPSEELVKPDPEGRVVHRSSPSSPFIIAKIFVRKLFQKGPLYYPFRRFILEEVDKHMLKSRITVRGGGLFGELIEPGVLFMECLLKTELVVRKAYTVTFHTQKLTPKRYRGFHHSKKTSGKSFLLRHDRGNYGIWKFFSFHKDKTPLAPKTYSQETHLPHKVLRKTNI